MVEWWIEMMMMVSRPKSNLPYLTQREYLVRTTTNQSDLFIAEVYVLGTFRTKKTSDYRQGYSIPSYTMSPMTMMMMMISIGKAKQSFLPRTTPRTNFLRQRGQDRVVGSSVVIGRAM